MWSSSRAQLAGSAALTLPELRVKSTHVICIHCTVNHFDRKCFQNNTGYFTRKYVQHNKYDGFYRKQEHFGIMEIQLSLYSTSCFPNKRVSLLLAEGKIDGWIHIIPTLTRFKAFKIRVYNVFCMNTCIFFILI